MRINFIILFLLVFGHAQVISQNLAAFTDYQKNFWVFDSGKFRQLEYQPVLSYQTADHSVGYVTNGNHFKIYTNHIDYDINPLVDNYNVTNHLATYEIGTQLYVFENGQKQLLSKFVGNYLVGDSVVAFFDTEQYFFQAYYKGEIINLEDGLIYANARAFLVGNNIVAYIDAFNNFKVFYNGQVTELLQTGGITAKIGRNVMAFLDPYSDFLQVFYKGQVIEQENFRPMSFQVGYEKVAYVDNMETFKLFDNGETYIVSDFKPDKYQLKDNMLVFHQQGQLFAFYKGERYLIENYIPAKYEINDDAIAYLDQNGYLNLFDKGEHKVLTYEVVNDFEVMRNVVIFNVGMNTTKVYFEGNIYTK